MVETTINYEKRVPADTSLDHLTFLNDKKIDGELYAYLLTVSYGYEGETVVWKNTLPTQSAICSALGIKSPKTLRAHFNYLIDTGYLIEEKDRYILPREEEFFEMIPHNTLKILNDTMQQRVIQIYVYLLARWKYKGNEYEFTAAELAAHVGIKLEGNMRGYETINNCLLVLSKVGLVKYVEFFKDNKPLKRLTLVSTKIEGR